MKLNLTLNAPERLGGYVNIDPWGPYEAEGFIRGSVGTLDQYVKDGECESIIAQDVLDYFSPDDVDNVLDNWIKKLRRGGSITIGGLDMMVTAKYLVTEAISLESANILFFGKQRLAWESRKSPTCISHMDKVLKSQGIKIVKRQLLSCFYTLTGEKV